MSAPGLLTMQLLLLLDAWWARAAAPRCTYTFVLPPQKFTGAVCWSGPAAPRPTPEAVNASDVAALRVRVGRHEELLRELQRLATADGAVAGEVRALRKESRGLSARLGQLRAQLQHEAGPGAGLGLGAEPAAALALLGERVLNASAEAQRAAARFHQLDVKFRELAQLVSQQSGLISRLERLCPGSAGGQQQVTLKLSPSPNSSHFLRASSVDGPPETPCSFFFFGRAAGHAGSSFPDQGWNPCPLQWKHRILTTGPPGKSQPHDSQFQNTKSSKNGPLPLSQ